MAFAGAVGATLSNGARSETTKHAKLTKKAAMKLAEAQNFDARFRRAIGFDGRRMGVSASVEDRAALVLPR
jgi:hypothetical protein